MTATGPTHGQRTEQLVALRWDGNALQALDQTALPWREEVLRLRNAAQVAGAIRRLQVRGAPLIGVAAAYGLALDLAQDPSPQALTRAGDLLRETRPTAVNLARAINRVTAAALRAPATRMSEAALAEAAAIDAEELAASDAIAEHGADLLAEPTRILTHCNTGALAAPGRGTALAVIFELAERGTLAGVLATESRPLLQGARLTAYELSRSAIPYELIVDAAAPGLIARGEVEAVIVGCDRVAANGDVANKVGTYGLALAASEARIPFVVAGPTSSIDFECPSGAQIVIEERDPQEVRIAGGQRLTMPDARCRNPAFDITPAALVTALVTERGIAGPVSADSLLALRPG
jgi:methylthioribose-1-phosphate isomerase